MEKNICSIISYISFDATTHGLIQSIQSTKKKKKKYRRIIQRRAERSYNVPQEAWKQVQELHGN